MAWTGLSQKALAALQPSQIDLVAGTLLTTARRKGAGVAPALLPLLPQAVTALRAFAAANAWGPFSAASMRKSWLRAAAAAGLPPGTRPYDLRHSYGTAVFLASGSLEATGALLQHADARTTRRYALAAVHPVLTAALGRWPHTPQAGPVVGPAPPEDIGKQAANDGSERPSVETSRAEKGP
jgi:integrase